MITLTLVGGPTAVLEYAGLRWLTDPALSPPGEYAVDLIKTTGPAIEPEALLPIDVVLLSHEHHSDNLDPAGREFLPGPAACSRPCRAPSASAATRLASSRGHRSRSNARTAIQSRLWRSRPSMARSGPRIPTGP